MKGSGARGLTLIEVLVALVLAGMTVAAAGYLFMGAKTQAWMRGRESAMLRDAVHLRAALEDSLQTGALACGEGATPMARDGGAVPAWVTVAHWKVRLADLQSLEFRCGKAGPPDGPSGLLAWKAEFRYRGVIRSVQGFWTP